jgi:hypothetical protein
VCSLLCLESHHSHGEMAGMTRSATSPVACHTDIGPATHRAPAQTLSPMEPGAPQPPLRLVSVSVQAPGARATASPRTSPSLDPPPPRLV